MLTRGMTGATLVFDIAGGTLNLGKPGFLCDLTINGANMPGVSAPLVEVSAGGILNMYDGVKLKDNDNSPIGPAAGGAVRVSGGISVFNMYGGEISGNKANAGSGSNASGGGVAVYNWGTFKMGEPYPGFGVLGTPVIQGNSANSNVDANGGGVYVYQGSFTIVGNAKIINNSANSTAMSTGAGGARGGGVYGDTIGATFEMKGGEISNNKATIPPLSTAEAWGGGMYIEDTYFNMSGGVIGPGNSVEGSSLGTFKGGGVFFNDSTGGSGVSFNIKNGAKITGNTTAFTGNALNYGGGVYIQTMPTAPVQAILNMDDDAVISLNKAHAGGGVYLDYGRITMKGRSIISENIADLNGGGVYITGTGSINSAEFNMEDGIVSGNEAQRGGGVYVSIKATFTMGASVGVGNPKIEGNTAYSSTNAYGGGVYVQCGFGVEFATFTMNSGVISKNNAGKSGSASSMSNRGGGVYLDSDFGTDFIKNGGIIYGVTDTPSVSLMSVDTNSNVVYDNLGVRVTTPGSGYTIFKTWPSAWRERTVTNILADNPGSIAGLTWD